MLLEDQLRQLYDEKYISSTESYLFTLNCMIDNIEDTKKEISRYVEILHTLYKAIKKAGEKDIILPAYIFTTYEEDKKRLARGIHFLSYLTRKARREYNF